MTPSRIVGPVGLGIARLVGATGAGTITPVAPAPANTLAPIVTGSLVQGALLSCTQGSWTGALSYTYQWLRDGVPIVGATAATRTVTLADSLAVMTCAVTATGPGGVSAPVSSTPVGPWMPTDLGLASFLHTPWEAAPAGLASMAIDWAVAPRLWGQDYSPVTYVADAGDGLAAWVPVAPFEFWDRQSAPLALTREFTVFSRAAKSSAPAYLWQGGAGSGPAIISGFGLGAFYWFGNSGGDRYVLQALPGDNLIHTVAHIHAAGSVRGRFDGADAYNINKTTDVYTGLAINRMLLAQGSNSWRGAVRTWGLLNRVITADELATLESWLATPRARRVEPLTVASPAPWQTYQRALPAGTGTIPIAATLALPYRLPGVGAEARFANGPWVPLTVVGGSITGSITGVAPARDLVEVRLTGSISSLVSIASVAVGDVYVIAGQSNAMGQANALQTSVGALGTGLFGTSYRWFGPASDPASSSAGQVDLVANNAGSGGSCWPALGDLLNTRDAVPIAFVPCAKGDTVHAQWLPGANRFDRTTLYGQMAHRAQLTGARAVLWYLGESDVLSGNTAASVQASVEIIATAIAADLGIPSYHAKIHAWSGGPSITAVNTGITAGVAAAVNALPGPDQSGLTLGNIHYLTTPELTQLATAWRNSLP